MSMFRHIILAFFVCLASMSHAQQRGTMKALGNGDEGQEMPTSSLLTGTVIGTELSVDYSNGSMATLTVNTRENAFDHDLSTFFASYERSKTWAGLDLGEPCVITRVGWSPRNDGLGPKRMVLGLFEGANREDFLDAVPLWLIDEQGTIGAMSYADVEVSRGFRYVRYVGPSDARCNVAELEFWGYKSEGDDSRFHQLTNLPTVSIHTEGNVDPYDKVNDIPSNITLIYNRGTRIQEELCTSRLRGNASYNFPKKPYRIKLEEKKHMFKGDTVAMRSPAKAKKWTLINNYGDKTLMRNIVAFEVARRMGMKYVPWCQPVDVIVNGEYKGCYQLTDQITIGKDRVNITEMTPDDIDPETITGGYLIELDGYAEKETSWFTSRYGHPVTIKSPDEDDITPEQHQYIERFFNQMETRVMANSYADPVSGYRSMLDVPTLLQYLVVEEVVANPDAFWSCYMYKDRGDNLLHVGPCWDFDNAFDNDWRCYPTSSQSDLLALHNSGAGNYRDFLKRIFTDTLFTDSLKTMWKVAREERGIDESSLLAYIDSTAAVLQASQRLNFMRWPILDQKVHENPVALGSYEAEVGRVKDFVTGRLSFLDRMIESKNRPAEDIAPVEIYTAEEMVDFARRVNSGETKLNARLMENIDLTPYPNTMIGQYAEYQGTFDGQGHSVNVNINVSQESAALFSKLGGTVKDLKVTGTIRTSQKYAGCIAGTSTSATILRCTGDATIISTVNGDGTHGVISGLTYTTRIEDCLASGSITGRQTNCCGGFVGWADSRTDIVNSVMVADISVSTSGSDVIARNAANVYIKDVYYNTSWSAANANGGTWAESNQLKDGSLCFHLNGMSSDGPWKETINQDAYPVLDPSHSIVYIKSRLHCDGTPYITAATYTNKETTFGRDEHQLVDGRCTVCGLMDDSTIEKDERGYYKINSAQVLAWFAEYVNTGHAKANAVLTEDIDFTDYKTTMIGSGTAYDGTFDGAGYSISIDLHRSQDYAGLFCHVSGIIKDLTVRGEITTSAKYAGGICSEMKGATLLRCQSYVTINASIRGDGTHGGLAALSADADETNEIESCLYAGMMTGWSTNCCGGLMGWATAPVIASNCLMIGDISVDTYGSDMLCRNNQNFIGTNNYYLTSWWPDTRPSEAMETDIVALRSGELCYQLNEGVTDGTQNWYQTLDEDEHPVPDNRHDGVMIYNGTYTALDVVPSATESASHAVYTLTGQRVGTDKADMSRLKKGIYIVDRKKLAN